MDTDWMRSGACRGMETNLWFPGLGQSVVAGRAKAVCADCPVKADCAEMALANPDLMGIWGGMSDRERNVERRRRGMIHAGGAKPQPIRHGTAGGYRAHYRHKVPMCDACREANMVAKQAQKERRARDAA